MADELGYHQMTAAAKRERNKGGLRNIGAHFLKNIWLHILHFTGKCIRNLGQVATDKNCM